MIENINLNEILDTHCTTTYNKFNGEEEIISSKEAVLIAIQEACNQTIDLCIQEQQKAYKELGYTNTGEKIGKLINEVKKLII